MVKVLISGYLGFSNSGDESILYAIQKNVKENMKYVSITALSKTPKETANAYEINSIYAFKPLDVIKEIKNSDIIISGGGTLLQDGTSSRSLWYYLSIIILAKLMNKKVMLYANGIGPLKKRFNRCLVKKIINKTHIITLREELSYEELKKLGVNKPTIDIAADPVFTLKGIDIEEAKRLLTEDNIPLDKPLVAVCFRKWEKDKNTFEKVAHICDEIVKRYNYNILFIPMQHPADLKISEEIENKMISKGYILRRQYTPDEIIGIIGLTRMMLSMRLHSLLYAGIKSIPMLGFVYDPKIKYYLEVLDMPSAGDVTQFTEEKVLSSIKHIEDDYDQLVSKLNTISDDLRLKAKKNNFYLTELINSIINGGKANEKGGCTGC